MLDDPIIFAIELIIIFKEQGSEDFLNEGIRWLLSEG